MRGSSRGRGPKSVAPVLKHKTGGARAEGRSQKPGAREPRSSGDGRATRKGPTGGARLQLRDGRNALNISRSQEPGARLRGGVGGGARSPRDRGAGSQEPGRPRSRGAGSQVGGGRSGAEEHGKIGETSFGKKKFRKNFGKIFRKKSRKI